MEGMGTRRDCRVNRSPRSIRIKPIGIDTVHSILKAYFLRRSNIHGFQMKLDVMGSGVQSQLAPREYLVLTNSDGTHKDLGLAACSRQLSEVNHGQAVHSCDPKLAIGRDRNVRSADTALDRIQSVCPIKQHIVERSFVICD